jgi:hypothetical protein
MKDLYNDQIREITQEMDSQMSNNILLRAKIKEI